MAVRRKSGAGASGYGTAPMPTGVQRMPPPQMPPVTDAGEGGIPPAPPSAVQMPGMQAAPQMGMGMPQQPQQQQQPQQPRQPPAMTPGNIDPFLAPGGGEDMEPVDPLTILSLMQSRGHL